MPGWPGMAPVADSPEARLALVVATGTYDDPGLRRLRAPGRDAADLAQVLADPDIGGFTVTTMFDQPAQLVRLAIEDFLDGRGTGDMLLVYFSCHGLVDARGRLYFAATDTRKDRLAATGVESGWVLDQLEYCRGRRQVLILDSCFSGAIARGAKGEADLDLPGRFLGQGRGRVVLTASTATEYSFEGEPTDAAAPAGSVFTAALVQGLRTGAADIDDDGHISVDDAYAYVFNQVRAAGAAQTPLRWVYAAEGKGLFLARNPAREATAHQNVQEVADTPRAARRAPTLLDTKIPRLAHSLHHESISYSYPAINSVAFSPDGRLLASGPQNGDPRLWDLATGECLRTLELRRWWDWSFTKPTDSVAFSPDGHLLATSYGETVRLWDPATGGHRRTLTGHTNYVYGVAFSPDGRLLATVSSDQTVRIWDPGTGGHLRTLTGHTQLIRGVAFSPDGRLLATVSYDQTVRIWDPATGGHRCILTGHTNGVKAVAFSPDGRLLASASFDQTVRLWDPAICGHLRTLTGHTDVVNGVAFSPDGLLLASCGEDKTVRLWDPVSGEHLRTLSDRTGEHNGVAFSPDGLLVASGDDSAVQIWDLASAGKQLATPGRKSMRTAKRASRGSTPLAATAARTACFQQLFNREGGEAPPCYFDGHKVRLSHALHGDAVLISHQQFQEARPRLDQRRSI